MLYTKEMKRKNELVKLAEEWNRTIYEVMYELVFEFYLSAGFWKEELEEELSSLSEAELLKVYCNI